MEMELKNSQTNMSYGVHWEYFPECRTIVTSSKQSRVYVCSLHNAFHNWDCLPIKAQNVQFYVTFRAIETILVCVAF